MTYIELLYKIRDRLMSAIRLAWTTSVGICALTGFIGITSGFALFILFWREPELGLFKLAVILGIAAVLSYFFEHLRAQIEDHHESRRSPNQMLTTLVMLAVFELFVTALHSAASISLDNLGLIAIAIIGPDFANFADTAAVNLLLMVAVWIVIGVVVGAALGHLIVRFQSRPSATRNKWAAVAAGLAWGGAVAIVTGSIVVLLYVLGIRSVTEYNLMTDAKTPWFVHLWNIQNKMQWISFEGGIKGCLRLIRLLPPRAALAAIVAALYLLARPWKRIPVLLRAFVALNVLGAATLAYAVPLAGPSLSTGVEQIVTVVALVAAIWFLPGAVLGALVAHLEKPSDHRRIWGFIALAVAIALEATSKEKLLASIVAFGLAMIGMFFLSNFPIDEYWVAIALGAGLVALGCTEIASRNFIEVQSRSLAVISAPLGISAPQKNDYKGLFGISINPKILVEPDPIPIPEHTTLETFDKDLNDSGEALAKHRERSDKMSRAADTLAVSEHDTRVSVVKTIFKRDATQAILAREIESNEMGELTAIKGFFDDPETMKSEDLFIQRLYEEIETAEKAMDAIETNVSMTAPQFDSACKQRSIGGGFCTADSAMNRRRKIAELEGTRSALSASLAKLATAKSNYKDAIDDTRKITKAAGDKLPEWRTEVIEKFELCVNGSLGFWITIGMLAGWAVQKKRLKTGEQV
jgi:hypothetical protein